MAQYRFEANFNVLISSNDDVPLYIEEGDRRFWIRTTQRRAKETARFISQELITWLKDESGLQIRNFLEDVEDKPADVPRNTTKTQAKDLSLSKTKPIHVRKSSSSLFCSDPLTVLTFLRSKSGLPLGSFHSTTYVKSWVRSAGQSGTKTEGSGLVSGKQILILSVNRKCLSTRRPSDLKSLLIGHQNWNAAGR